MSIVALAFSGCSDLKKSKDQSINELIVFPFDNAVRPVEGSNINYKATVVFFDNSFEVVTEDVTWSSSNTTVAIIENNGSVTVNDIGYTIITAKYQVGNSVFEKNVRLNIRENLLKSITIIGSTNVPLGASQLYIARGDFGEVSLPIPTSLVTWESINPSVATIREESLSIFADTNSSATVDETTIITARYKDTAIDDAITLTIVDPVIKEITGISYTPVQPTSDDDKITFAANVTWSDGRTTTSTNDVVWRSSNDNIIVFNNILRNVGTILSVGDVNITAKKDLFSPITYTESLEVVQP